MNGVTSRSLGLGLLSAHHYALQVQAYGTLAIERGATEQLHQFGDYLVFTHRTPVSRGNSPPIEVPVNPGHQALRHGWWP
jgi:hypothetical protein